MYFACKLKSLFGCKDGDKFVNDCSGGDCALYDLYKLRSEISVEQIIPVNTSDTPEWGSSVRPRYLHTVSGICVSFAPLLAPKYFPKALAAI